MNRYNLRISSLPPLVEKLLLPLVFLYILIIGLTSLIFLQNASLQLPFYLCLVLSIIEFIWGLEFILRSSQLDRQNEKRAFGRYLLYQWGWLDLVLSWGVLFFIELPHLLIYFLAGSDLELFKLVQNYDNYSQQFSALRYLAILKVLIQIVRAGDYKNSLSLRHLIFNARIVIFGAILGLSLFNVFDAYRVSQRKQEVLANYDLWLRQFSSVFKDLEASVRDFGGQLRYQKQDGRELTLKNLAEKFFVQKERQPLVVQLYYQKQLLVSNYTLDQIRSQFFTAPWEKTEKSFIDKYTHTLAFEDYLLVISSKSLYDGPYLLNSLLWLLLVGLILYLWFYYRTYFQKNIINIIAAVSDGMVNVVNNELIEIKNLKFSEEDEIYRLIQNYNSFFLPLKLEKVISQRKNQITELKSRRILK